MSPHPTLQIEGGKPSCAQTKALPAGPAVFSSTTSWNAAETRPRNCNGLLQSYEGTTASLALPLRLVWIFQHAFCFGAVGVGTFLGQQGQGRNKQNGNNKDSSVMLPGFRSRCVYQVIRPVIHFILEHPKQAIDLRCHSPSLPSKRHLPSSKVAGPATYRPECLSACVPVCRCVLVPLLPHGGVLGIGKSVWGNHQPPTWQLSVNLPQTLPQTNQSENGRGTSPSGRSSDRF